MIDIDLTNVRTIEENNKTYFSLKDICEKLELSNSRKVKQQLVKEYAKDATIKCPLITNGGKQNGDYIDEEKIKFLISRSKIDKVKGIRNKNYIKQKEYIYIIKCNEYIKIGYSNNVKNRYDQINSSNPYETELLFYYEVENAKKKEKELHDIFKLYRTKGEWFLLEKINLDYLKKLIINKEGK